MNTPKKLLLSLTLSLTATSVLAAEPNNDFASATVLAPGVSTVSDSLTGSSNIPIPDLVMGSFDELGNLLATDDDSSGYGDGLAPGFSGMQVNSDGSIDLRVSGYDDFNFDGLSDSDNSTPVSELGDFTLYVDVLATDGTLLDSFYVDDGLYNDGEVAGFNFSDSAWIGASFDAQVDNMPSGGNGSDPLDFWVFTGLTPGASYNAELTFGDFDPILGWFDDNGNLLDSDDDSGFDLLPLLNFTASVNGEAVLAVSGYPDFDFIGDHAEIGDYVLEVTAVPVPAAVWLFASGLLGLAGVARRKVS